MGCDGRQGIPVAIPWGLIEAELTILGCSIVGLTQFFIYAGIHHSSIFVLLEAA